MYVMRRRASAWRRSEAPQRRGTKLIGGCLIAVWTIPSPVPMSCSMKSHRVDDPVTESGCHNEPIEQGARGGHICMSRMWQIGHPMLLNNADPNFP